MGFINDLPVEILLQIISECQLPANVSTPIVGSNAAWKPLSNFVYHDPSLSAIGFGHDTTYNSALKSLRLTNKAMNILAQPYLFQEVNLLYNLSSKRGQSVQKYVIEPHGAHVRVIRMDIDAERGPVLDEMDIEQDPQEPSSQVKSMAAILAACPNVGSLGLFYRRWNTDFAPITDKVMKMIERGSLVALGVYSLQVTDNPWAVMFINGGKCGSIEFLNTISTVSTPNLKALDIVNEWMPPETYAHLQKSPAFAQLSSLTVRYAFRHALLWVPDPAKRLSGWAPRAHLTRLQLISCQTAYAPDIPILVGLFEALEELLVSTCGYREDVIPPPRSTGWSAYPDALWKRKTALKEFVIEHMDRWEILALGVIPAQTVICANVQPGAMLKALEEDKELFPGIKVLRVLPNRVYRRDELYESSEDDEEDGTHDVIRSGSVEKRLDTVCGERKVELRRDASRYRPCTCCSYSY
ncbi:hypothetical protein M408DRAFT_101431 [Serendipita vermifera MAFF 305830]|uniref:F-box domain-containing protein n=1 Tax=Serendipita vermifera MAFF 305830 TaxID=933852 RepID=A0A0C3BDE7_SERVB|nr:hypothetical protein M408DRAFT_101431 [Serendipita vermifera MAFF 305830]